MASRSLSDIPLQNLYHLLQPLTLSPDARFTNWGRTFTCQPLAVFLPETEYQCELILELARREGKTVRAVGVGHSPSDLACTNEYMLRTERLNRLLEVHTEKNYVVVQGGITLSDLHLQLAKHKLAMMNVGSISDQTLAGIVTTATHGSGIDFGVMSTHALGLTLLLADGSRVFCSRYERANLFMATICGLGSTGLILNVHLQVEPAFMLKEYQESLSFNEAMENLDTIVHSGEHVRFWWFYSPDTVRVSVSNRTDEPRKPAFSWLWHSLMGYHLVQLLLFIGRFFLCVNTWTCRFAAWLTSSKSVGVDVSHAIFNVECRYPQHTTEWAVPYENTVPCLREFRDWVHAEIEKPDGIRPHFPVEIRFSAADDIWLSPSSGGRTCWIGIMQYKPYDCNVPYRKLFEGFEAILSKYQGRPHWAKAHNLRPDTLRKMYPRFDDFIRVLEDVDSTGMFRNDYINRHIFGHNIAGRIHKSRKE
ncbi:gulonolactone oxidase Lgo1 [Pleurotus eryngii]|uniref:D-arabinono-1,4-lactone oxidase n=1 Tax=Pleurotus eryngii TaxID=5323 RepID=A0A9P5ZPA9_PLEER|nr:gulonolactone oxidase Lgo1 [Pleurotus eryngii]